MRPAWSVLALCLLATACASPVVDETTSNFDEEQYATDLDECRGGSVITASLHGIGGAFGGSFVASAEGANSGLTRINSPEGAIIAAVVGGVIGFGAGAYKALENNDGKIEGCLIQKGYTISSR